MTLAGQSSPSDAPRQARSDRLYFWFGLLIAASVGRVAVAASHPLFEVECYYYLWSRHLAFGYFDHPPMLGYFIRLFDFFGPPHSLAARFHAVVAHFLTSLMLFLFARNLFGSARIGLRTVLIFNLLPIFSLAAIQNEPDVPLIFFWTATLLSFERALATGAPRWWLILGVCAGGALLSKFHAVFLLGCLGLYLLCSRKDRHHLLRPWPYVAVLVAIVIYSPNFIWNARHDWLTYRFQLAGRVDSSEFEPFNVARTLLWPIAYLSPPVYIAMLISGGFAGWQVLKRRDGGRARSLLFFASLPLFAFFIAISFIRLVKFHWPVISFLALCPLLAADLERRSRTVRTALYSIAGGFTFVMYATLVHPYPLSRILPNSWVPESLRMRPDESRDKEWIGLVFGHRELGEQVREAFERENGAEPVLIMARDFDQAATASFYAGYPDSAYVPEFGDLRGFTVWGNPDAQPGADALFVQSDLPRHRKRDNERDLQKLFKTVGPARELNVSYRGHVLKRWYVTLCEDMLPAENESVSESESPKANAAP